MTGPGYPRLWAGLAGLLVLVLPPVRHHLEATMTAQMLVQLPLLAGLGWVVARAGPDRVGAALARWDHAGVPGLLLASFTGALWMLPRLIDASVDDPRVALAKFTTVPLLVGVPVALSWPRAGFVVRGVFLLELIATAFRLGWLYLISPVRLCSNYLLDDQQRLGEALLGTGIALTLLVAWKLIWGRIRVEPMAMLTPPAAEPATPPTHAGSHR